MRGALCAFLARGAPAAHHASTRGGALQGQSLMLEKSYTRLTALPNAADVRPLPVLRDALELVQRKWRAERDYVYACDMLKAIRQDLTVQHLTQSDGPRADFALRVYEAHATMEAESVEERATKVTFDSKEDPEEVIDALMKQRQDLPYETGYDYVVVRTLCSASSVAVQLSVEKFQPKPVALKVSLSGKMTTSASHAGLAKVLKQCQLGCLRRLSVHDGLFAVVSGLRDRWNSIRSLDASNNALETLPKGVFANFPHLEVLRLDRNRLTTLPNLNSFTLLKELHVNDNALTALPIDLVEDLDLEVLSLEFNRLNKLHVKLKDLSKLRALCLLENPIETLPRLNKSGNQRCLSLANVKVWKDEVTGDVDVEVQETGSSYFSSIVGGKAQKDKAYTAFLNLIFHSSECQNSLLVAAVKAIASKSRENCEAIVNTEGAS